MGKKKHTYDTICTHFQGIISNIYCFGRPFLHFCYPSTHISTHPYSFYPSKWRVDGPLHKAMLYTHLSNNVYKWKFICFFNASLLYIYKTYILKPAPPLLTGYISHHTQVTVILHTGLDGYCSVTASQSIKSRYSLTHLGELHQWRM